MNLPEGFEFVKRIEPTTLNAIIIQELILQDLCANTLFEAPRALADPQNPDMVEAQRKRLLKNPERYCGVVTRNGLLIAFMKATDWLIDDESPFVSGPRGFWLRTCRVFRRSHLLGRPRGVFGLVVSEGLGEEERDSVFAYLLERSFLDAHGRPRTVNIVVSHVYEWPLRILRTYGFKQVGKPGEAAGASGVRQWRYRRRAS
jgi:hypothetical protein